MFEAIWNVIQEGAVIGFVCPRMGILIERRLVVWKIHSIRDLSPAIAAMIPRDLRGEWVVTGYDLHRREERTFIVESMQNVRLLLESDGRELPPLKIVIAGENGKFVKFAEMPDPRNGFCRHYNERSSNVAFG